MVILVTTVFSMICICCCLKEKKEGELAGKLDVVLKKLEAKRAKITELAEEQENLQNELKNMEGEAKELATGPGQAKAK
jgi:peptidoglycan hydrolase CwlO-like protein